MVQIAEKARFTLTVPITILLFILCNSINHVLTHGRLKEPPSRASMWRYGFDTPHNYNDHELYCGGFTRQWQSNGGKCGICGDAWDSPAPRAHELGGKYGKGIIVRKYRTGSVIPIEVELTANHFGYFEFRVCPLTFRDEDADQECLDKYILEGENGTTRYYPGPGNQIFESYYKLPDGLQCSHCVFQWRYIAGNNWGDCGNGTGAVGCGPQEEFRSCADVLIGDDEAELPRKPGSPKGQPPRPDDTEDNEIPSGPFWVLNFIIAGTTLLVVLAVLALIYTYYYHAGKAKQWLREKSVFSHPVPPPVAPPRLKKHSMTKEQLQL